MKALEEKIKREGKILPGNVLKVDNFLNHQIDVRFMCEIGKEFKRIFSDKEVTKILTIEASGIGIACITSQYFDCVPVVFAKKSKGTNIGDDIYSTAVMSFTHGNINNVIVSKKYLNPGDKVLIIDDFLAKGQALLGLCNLAEQAGADIVGAGIVIEKAYQEGRALVEAKGVRVESLAKIQSMSEDGDIVFC